MIWLRPRSFFFPAVEWLVAIHVLDQQHVSTLTPVVARSSLRIHCHLVHQRPWQRSMVEDQVHEVPLASFHGLKHDEAVLGK